MQHKTVRLNNDIDIPAVGFGTYLIPPGETQQAVAAALAAGYRHIDTASAYKNEQGVGAAVQAAGLPREELFITTKLWNGDIRKGKTEAAFEKSMQLLGLNTLDLYLIHWPADGYVEAYLAMEALYKQGRVRAIGVSNFQQHHIETLMEKATVTPAVNQIECHPYLSQEPLRAWCAKQGIVCEAWSPFGGKGGRVLKDKSITHIAAKYNRSAGQVVLRWLLQRGFSVNPKSVHEDRMRQNLQVFDFELKAEDIDALNALNQDKRMGPNPDNFKF